MSTMPLHIRANQIRQLHERGLGKKQIAHELGLTLHHITQVARAAKLQIPPPPKPPLTQRQQQILGMRADGVPSREIARQLWLQHDTVKQHCSDAIKRLGARDCAHAIAIALRQGLLPIHTDMREMP